MDVLVTTRFVDRLLLAKYPDNPDAADTPIGTVVTATPPRALELVRVGFATAIGTSIEDLEQAARDFELAAIAALTPAPVEPIDGDAPAPVAGDPVLVADEAQDPATAVPAEPSDGNAVDLSK